MASKSKSTPIKRPTMLGNQFAKDHGIGRPPDSEWSDELLIKLGEEMFEEINNHPDWCFIEQFALLKNIAPRKFYKFKDRKVFGDYYDKARNILFLRFLKASGIKEGGIPVPMAVRLMPVIYDPLREYDKEMKKIGAQQKATDLANVIQEIQSGEIASSESDLETE